MCENPQYCLMLKTEFDEKFKRFGVRSKLQVLGYVRDVQNGVVSIPKYDYKRYSLLVKECGKCRCCRFKQAAKKSAQAYCESKMHDKNCFLTLTFDREKLVKHYKEKLGDNYYMINKMVAMCEWTLEKEHFRNFVKRLRFMISQEDERNYCISNNLTEFLYKKVGDKLVMRNRISLPKEHKKFVEYRKIKVLHCGEYGELGERPHHHAIIFGFSFDDVVNTRYYRQGKLEDRNVSNTLNYLWSLGDCTCDKCTYQSINYVARYVTKKITGAKSDEYYQGRQPEYCTQSNRRGLGYLYFLNNYKQLINTQRVSIPSKKGKILNIPLPRYFRNLWREIDPKSFHKCVDDNIIKSQQIFENIKKNGLISNLEAKSSIINSVYKRCKRNFERCTSKPQLDRIHKKAKAFGIDLGLFDVYLPHFQKYLLNKSSNCFGLKYKDENNFKKYSDFENWRQRNLNRLRYDLSIDDEKRFFNMDFYLKLDNPFKNKGYTSKHYVYPLREFVSITWEKPIQDRVALYA